MPAEPVPNNMRQERRFKVDQPVGVTIIGTTPEVRLAGRIEDLSRSGLKLRLEQPVPFGSRLKMEWEDHMVFGSARYCTERRSAYSVGVQLFSSWESLTEDMLAREAAELARSNAELQQFAYAVSHDLNEHIRMITSYLQLLEARYRGKLDAEADDFINYAVEAALRMRKMLADLLAYSKATRGGMERKQTDFEALLQRVLRELSDAIERSRATVTHDQLPSLMANPPLILQLLQHLVDNALKFRRDVPPSVHIGVREETRDWIFSVSDNGIGVEPRYLERIFGVFERLHTKSEYPGTGLGLATCKMIVERHGGRIWAESEPGEGSVFYFSIPKDGWESS